MLRNIAACVFRSSNGHETWANGVTSALRSREEAAWGFVESPLIIEDNGRLLTGLLKIEGFEGTLVAFYNDQNYHFLAFCNNDQNYHLPREESKLRQRHPQYRGQVSTTSNRPNHL